MTITTRVQRLSCLKYSHRWRNRQRERTLISGRVSHRRISAQSTPHTQLAMNFQIHPEEFRQVVQDVVAETLSALDWPAGRIALTEAEAAAACGVARHVLRDLRLAGRIKAQKLGRKYVYRRSDLLEALK